MRSWKSNRLSGGCYALLALALAACSSHQEATGQRSAALTLTTGVVHDQPITYRQRLSLASIGNGLVQLANGQLVDVARVANEALAGHRDLAAQALAAPSALFGAVETTEELIETEHTVMLVATTKLVVADPAALANLAPELGGAHFKGPRAKPLAGLSPSERAFFDNFKAEVLLKPRQHPLNVAARKSDAALWAAAASGIGDLAIVTSVERPIVGLVSDGVTYQVPALLDGHFDFQNQQTVHIPGGFGSGEDTYEEQDPIGIDSTDESGSATTVSSFLNGFTEADAVNWGHTWQWDFVSVHVDAGAGYGYGIRQPIKVIGTMTPTDISHVSSETDVESRFDSSVRVETLDADADFYRDVGLSEVDVQQGQEFVANVGAEVHLKVKVLGENLVNVTLPKDFKVDVGDNYKPPLADCGDGCGPEFWVPASTTRTALSLGIAGANAQIGFKIGGEGQIDLDYQTTYDRSPVLSSSGAGDGKKTHRLSFTDTEARNFHTTLKPLANPGHKLFGYQVSDLLYTWKAELVPGVKGTLWVDCWPLNNWNHVIGPFWFPKFAVELGDFEFSPHAGTASSQAVNKGQKSWNLINVEQNDVPDSNQSYP